MASRGLSPALVERIDGLPPCPGVYLMKNDRGKVLYVGKAQNLRSRVRSYVGRTDGRPQIPRLMERVADVEVVATPNVKDALLLENELIKRHKPVFNVRLRDDKQYLALRLDPNETWPRLIPVRRFQRDEAWYFGPYTSSIAMREATSNLRRLFPLRSCTDATFRDYRRRGRPCIEYEMKRCVGPCCGLVDEASYAELVRGTALFLRGRSDELVSELRDRMDQASREERFEDAALQRDRISKVEETVQRQQIVSKEAVDRDVFGLARRGGEVEVQVFQVREGRVVGASGYPLSDVRLDDGQVMSSFLGQYYAADTAREVPKEVLTPDPIEDEGALEACLADRRGQRVLLRTPRKGRLRDLVTMASHNAELTLERRLESKAGVEAALEELAEALRLSTLPRRIECYDVSTLQGTLAVASRVVFQDGVPDKSAYRRYRIREAPAGDDYACLREVLQRRLARIAKEPLPDLLMVDGGKGQLAVVSAAVLDAGCQVEQLGLAKERDEAASPPRVKRGGGLKAERVFRPSVKDPILLPPSSRGLLLLQRVRDEAHRFAIEFQRSLRRKVGLRSILEELPGIGPAKRRALLRELGSLRAVRAATREQLASVTGISARDAATIRDFFDALETELGEPEAPT